MPARSKSKQSKKIPPIGGKISHARGPKARRIWNRRGKLAERLSTTPMREWAERKEFWDYSRGHVKGIRGQRRRVKLGEREHDAIHKCLDLEFGLLVKFNRALAGGIKSGRFKPKTFEFLPIEYDFAFKPGTGRIAARKRGAIVMKEVSGVNAEAVKTYIELSESGRAAELGRKDIKKIRKLLKKWPGISLKRLESMMLEVRTILGEMKRRPKTRLEERLSKEIDPKRGIGYDASLGNVIIRGYNPKTKKLIISLPDIFMTSSY